MTDVSKLDDLANKIASGRYPNIANYAKAQAAATQAQELELRRLAEEVEVLKGSSHTHREEPPPPPPDGGGGPLLRWEPPGYDGTGDPRAITSYPGFQEFTIDSADGIYNLTSGVDYLVHLGTQAWSSSTSRTSINIRGGRHIVIVGGAINFTSTNNLDDASGLLIDGGTVGGIVHIEGITVAAPNAFTIRTPRQIQIQNCRATCRTYNDDHSGGVGIHPDIVQIWRQASGQPRCAGLKFHRCSFYSTMTMLSDFTDESAPYGLETPAFWELHDSDIHGLPPLDGTVPTIGLANWMGYPQLAVWRGTNVWWETTYAPGYGRRNLGDMLRFHGEQYSPRYAGYQILDAGGNVLYTQAEDVASGAPGTTIGQTQGHWLRYHLNPNLTITWTCQIAPTSVGAVNSSGNFCAADAGASYVPPGYV